jgi:hypothetical protein
VLGRGEGVSHVCSNAALCTRLLEGRPLLNSSGLQQLTQRSPTAAELLLHESRVPVDDVTGSDNGDESSTDEASDDDA